MCYLQTKRLQIIYSIYVKTGLYTIKTYSTNDQDTPFRRGFYHSSVDIINVLKAPPTVIKKYDRGMLERTADWNGVMKITMKKQLWYWSAFLIKQKYI